VLAAFTHTNSGFYRSLFSGGIMQIWEGQDMASYLILKSGFNLNRHNRFSLFDEEVAELREAYEAGDDDAIEDEFGDVLFDLLALGTALNIDAEAALQQTFEKLRTRLKDTGTIDNAD
jgi:uncharacterized protein YabN with tetrapyrrole methylase and pyrophosphatase domain